ncbi:unnamed protein product [Victoria cruziana]
MALEVRQGNELTGFSFPPSSSPSSRRRPQVTLELFGLNSAPSPVELDRGSALPLGLHRFLDRKGDCQYYKQNRGRTMNRKDKQQGTNGKLDLKLNLSPPKDGNGGGSSDNNSQSSPSSYFSSSSSGTSPPSSCISSELNLENRGGSEAEQSQTLRYSNSPEATSMVLVGCPRCLMYVMLSEDDPKCPKCKSTCLLDFHQDGGKKTRNF